jgi:hypothetical protein
MLSLFAFDAMHTNAASSPSSAPSASAMVGRVLACSEFYRWRENCDGSRTAFFVLTKAIPGAAEGEVMTLAQLHEKLGGVAAR